MLEYVFFNRAVADEFLAALAERGITAQEGREAVEEAILIGIEEVDDDTWDALDALYETLSERDRALLEAGSPDAVHTAGIYLTLSDGRRSIARVEPAVVNRILQVLSMEEFERLVDEIVRAVEEPSTDPLCKRRD